MTDCIVIPTRGRAKLLTTKEFHTMAYAKHWIGQKFLAVPSDQVEAYKPIAYEYDCDIIRLQPEINTLAKTYDEVFNRAGYYDKVLMMDDDLVFSIRHNYMTTSITRLPLRNFNAIVDMLFDALKPKDVVLAGLAPRIGAGNYTTCYSYNQRLSSIIACKTPIVKKYMWEWGHDTLFEHYMNISLLNQGYKNTMVTKYVYNTVLDNHSGRRAYSDVHTYSESAKALAKIFPSVVKLREKSGYTDIAMYMKKAYGG